jgi:hypothetical protein
MGCDGERHVGPVERVRWADFGFRWRLGLRLWSRDGGPLGFGDVYAGESAGEARVVGASSFSTEGC